MRHFQISFRYSTVADAITIAVKSDCGALVCIGERRPSAGGIGDHDGSDGAGPPDDAELLSLFPPYRRVLQRAHPHSVDDRDDVLVPLPSQSMARVSPS